MFLNIAIRTAKIAVAVVIVLVSSCKTSQQSGNSTSVVLDKPISNNRSLLWQISGNGLSQPSYLFGTIHIISNEDFSLGINAEKKIKTANTLVLEMDMKNINPLTIATVSLLPDNKTVEDYLDPDDYSLLQSYFVDTMLVSPMVFKNAYARMKPFFLQQMLFIRYLGENTESYELVFTGIADDNEIEVVGLETLEQQLGFLDEIPMEQQLEGLVRSIREFGEETAYFDTMIQAYKAQDIDKLYDIIMGHEDMKDISNTLLDERNEAWISKLEQLFKKGKVFVAVGAGHLGGKTGVIQLLKDKGYTVEPISTE